MLNNINKINNVNSVHDHVGDENGDFCIDKSKQRLQKAIERVNEIILDKERQIKMAFICFLAGGHLLIEDIPGTGKTILARGLGEALSLDFKRVQFTSDLLPSDILGVSIYKKEKEDFELHKGPVFTNILLADEINRASPKTQSALLEVMSEGRVSIDGKTQKVSDSFMVIATQNPLDYSGTFPLPDAQKDRFLFCISMGYPSALHEMNLMRGEKRSDMIERGMSGILLEKDIKILKEAVKNIRINDNSLSYAHKLISATRNKAIFSQGLSTRAAISFIDAAKANAFLEDRRYVTPDDLQNVFIDLASHRVLVENENEKEVLKNIIDNTKL